MRIFDGIADARDAAADWFHDNKATLPENVRDQLMPLFRTGVNAVDVIVSTQEIIFANEGALDKDAKELGAGLADYRDAEGYHRPEDEPDRAKRIKLALQRASGQKAPGSRAWPNKKDDPAPLERFRPAPPSDDEAEPKP